MMNDKSLATQLLAMIYNTSFGITFGIKCLKLLKTVTTTIEILRLSNIAVLFHF